MLFIDHKGIKLLPCKLRVQYIRDTNVLNIHSTTRNHYTAKCVIYDIVILNFTTSKLNRKHTTFISVELITIDTTTSTVESISLKIVITRAHKTSIGVSTGSIRMTWRLQTLINIC